MAALVARLVVVVLQGLVRVVTTIVLPLQNALVRVAGIGIEDGVHSHITVL